MAQNGSSGLKKSIWAAGQSRSHIKHTYNDWNSRPPRATEPPRLNNQSRTNHNHEPSYLAPAPAPSTASSNARLLAPAQALHRFEQTCLRLKWKSIDLENAYQRTRDAAAHGFEPAHAERNFKVDFYEFYAWIEQGLVLLQRIFGVEIMPGVGTSSSHAYHHNVLKALEDEDNPLHTALGSGEVNHALWKAKELRNRWKDAAGEADTPPLGMYDLRWIVLQILGGLEAAYLAASERVRLVQEQTATKETTNGVQASSGAVGDGGEGDEGWDWMVEPMDWEA